MRLIHRTLLPGVLLTATVLTFPVNAQSSRPSIAILSFDYGTIQRWWSGTQDIGEGISDLIVDELVNDGSFRVFERKRLNTLLAEQNFQDSDRIDPTAKLAKIGKMAGVKYVVAGSVTKFGTEQSSKGVGGGGFGYGGFGIGSVGTSKGKANVAITARIIDVETGEIMASAKGDGTSKRSGFLLGGAGGGSGGGGGGVINFTASDFHDTILGEATEIAVKMTVSKLVAAKTRLQ